MRQRSGPFDGAGNGAAVGDLDDLVALGEGCCGGEACCEREGQKERGLACPTHSYSFSVLADGSEADRRRMKFDRTSCARSHGLTSLLLGKSCNRAGRFSRYSIS